MADKKLETAQELIRDGHYDAARGLLATMPENETAQRWLKRLNAPPEALKSGEPRARRPYVDRSVPAWVMALAVLLLVAVLAAVGYGVFVEPVQRQRAAAEYSCGLSYERYTTQWQNCVDDR